MFDPEEYELLDFSNGEKLERFGNTVVRRQTPSVAENGAGISSVPAAQLRYKRQQNGDKWTGESDPSWSVKHRAVAFRLRPTPAGQVGVFPEQASNWDWILDSGLDLRGLKAINLFGYTGGTTLTLAKAGANVTHVDAAKNVVSWARENADASNLLDHPIRWITEDASRFVEREVQRGNDYDIFIADPPSFGRGPAGETWKLERDLPGLLSNAAKLTNGRAIMVVISCHTPGYDGQRLSKAIGQAWGISQKQISSGPLLLKTADGSQLHCGDVARWHK